MTNSQLTVRCRNGGRKEDKSVVSQMCHMLTRHFADLGFGSKGGVWNVDLFKKTGGGTQERINFKRVHRDNVSGGKSVLEYFIRPYDRDSSWLIFIDPPDGVSCADVEKLEDPKPAAAVEPAPSDIPSVALNVNQVYRAKIAKHGEHGLEIMLDEEKNLIGFIPLSDLCMNGKYDKKELNKYPVGSIIKAAVVDATKLPIVCTSQLDGIIETDHPQDVFTGTAGGDGLIKLGGFTRSQSRVYELIEWLAMHAADRDPDKCPKPIPFDEAAALVDEYVLTKYGAKPHKSASLLNALCIAGVEPMLEKIDRCYFPSKFAWSELGGIEAFQRRAKGIKDPEPEIQEEIVETAVEPVEEVAAETVVALEEVIGTAIANHQRIIPLDEVVEYLGKAVRLAEVNAALKSYGDERDELAKWLSENAEIREYAKSFQAAVREGQV